MSSDDVDWYCPCCGIPMPACALPANCALNGACCTTCFITCEAMDRCGLITDETFWAKRDEADAKIGAGRFRHG